MNFDKFTYFFHSIEIVDHAKNVAKNFIGKVAFIFVDIEKQESKNVQDLFGIKANMIPAIRLISISKNNTKYMPSSKEITAESINEFIDDYLHGKLQPYLKYQEPPSDWNERTVKILVSKTFDNVVFNRKKNVFVLFCNLHFILFLHDNFNNIIH